jgi:tetratricopeptide (TPR) repeat protein
VKPVDRDERMSALDAAETRIVSIAPDNFRHGAKKANSMKNSDGDNGKQAVQDEGVAALLDLALGMDQAGSFEEMLVTAQSAVEQAPASALALACKARALQKLERLSEATIANDQALLLDTHLALAWINRSGLQIVQGRFPEGLRSAARAIELAPQDPRAWANRGMALFNLNNSLDALTALNQSLACDRDFLFALQMKGEILRRYGRMHELVETMQHALGIAPLDLTSLNLLVIAYRALEEYEQLVLVTGRLMQFTTGSLFTWDSHMRALRALGRFAEAQSAIERCLELAPNDARFWTTKADNLFRLERFREAAQAAEHALHFDTQYAPARRIHEKAVRMMYQRKTKRQS